MKIFRSLFVGLIAGASFLIDAEAAVPPPQPNFILIMADNLGYGDIEPFGSKLHRTPNLNRMAREGRRLTSFYSASGVCTPSRAALMTGSYPRRVGLDWTPEDGHVLRPVSPNGLHPKEVTIAEVLKKAGYATACIGKWHLGFKENGYDKPLPGGPVDRGFGSYFGIRASTDIPPYFYIRGNQAVAPPTNHIEANNSKNWSPIQGAFWRAGGIAPGLQLKDVLPRFTDEAVTVIEAHAKSDADKPLMLYLAYPAPHTPWLPSPKFQGSSKAGMYGDFLVMVDAMIGRVLKALDKAGMSEDTLLFFTSDNGPVWYDADVKRLGHDSTVGLRGMKADAWEGGHRVPFIARWPGKIRAGSLSNQTICFTDMLATFAAVVDAQLPRDAGPDSFNILPVLLGEQPEAKPIRGPLVIPARGGVMSIRSGHWKLITGLGSGGFSKPDGSGGFSKPNYIKPKPGGPRGQLYHLGNDLAETRNLYLERPDIVKSLQAKLEQIRNLPRTRP